MRLHTKLSREDIGRCLLYSQQHDKIMPDVGFRVMLPFHSQTHDRAFEIQLGAPRDHKRLPAGTVNQYGRTQKTRRVSQGGYGSQLPFAATWHEHGWFMAEVYKADPGAVFGSGKSAYRSADDFHEKTKYEFDERTRP